MAVEWAHDTAAHDTAAHDTAAPRRQSAAARRGDQLKPTPVTEAGDDHRWRGWTAFVRGFYRCHRSPLNNAIHLVSTPLGLLGCFTLAASLHPLAAIVLAIAWTILIATLSPRTVAAASGLVLIALAAAAAELQWGVIAGVVLLVAGFGIQDVAHWLTAEATYQSSYRHSSSWWRDWWVHSLLLMPALLVCGSRPRSSPLRLLVARKAVLKTTLRSEIQRADMGTIMKWVRDRCPALSQSTHWWQSDLSEDAGDAFQRLACDGQLIAMLKSFHGRGYRIDPVFEMNEIYVTGPVKETSSDKVFYMGHVDGPWAVFPAARLYRCMLALNENREVTTWFSMSHPDGHADEGYRLQNGDAVAFDFNRELHYITRIASAETTEPRVNLKLHFVAYPTAVPLYGKWLRWLTATYDIRARQLFLQTINPDGMWAKLRTYWVLGWTGVFEWVVRRIGWTNLAYVAAVLLAAVVTRQWVWFLAATGFVHYAIYLGTMDEPDRVSFGTFRRDAMFFKSVSLASLLGLYAASLDGHVLSPALVAAGFLLSGWASWVLGMNRTLFSAELGFDPPVRMRRFPYGWIPHPMILGTVAAIASMALVPGFRNEYGWLIVGHLACYGVVLWREVVLWRKMSRHFPPQRDCRAV